MAQKEAIELNGTVKKMSPSGKGFMLNEYDDWFNFGNRYDGPRPFAENAAITLTYEENVRQDGTVSFFVLSAWPTTGQAGPVPPQVTPAGPKPTANPQTPGYVETVIEGPRPTPTAQPTSYGDYQAAATGPVPTPPNRENAILFQVCLKAAVEWVPRRYRHGDPNRSEGQVLFVADLFYHDALKVISGEEEKPQDGDPGPEEPA